MDDDIEQQALAWHDRLREPPSAATRQAFEVWQAADPRHAEAFAQQGRLAAEIRGGGWRGIMPQPRAQPLGRRLSSGLVVITAAAAAAGLILVLPHSRPIGPTPTAVADATPALTKARRLADGSLVILASEAEVASDPGDARAARLVRGAARFIVVHDPAHPYRVTADGTTITARGTVFDVVLTPNGPRVTLIDGRIDVTRPAGLPSRAARTVVLKPGESLSPDAADAAEAGSPSPITWIEVDGMTLQDLLTIAARGSGATIRLADPTLGGLRVTGRFDVAQSLPLAAKLAAALGLRETQDAGGLVLERSK